MSPTQPPLTHPGLHGLHRAASRRLARWMGRVVVACVCAGVAVAQNSGQPGGTFQPVDPVDPETGTPPENDDCIDAVVVGNGVIPFSTLSATTDGAAHPNCPPGSGQTYADVWFRYQATCTGTLIVSTCNSVNYDSDIVVYGADGPDCDAIDCPPGNAFLLGCNDDMAGCASFSSRVEVDAVAGHCYLVRVGGFDSDADRGSGTIRLGCMPATCGNGALDAGEDCDTNGTTAMCDSDCTLPVCGDGIVNGPAGEACEVISNTADCDSDCTLPRCGDGLVNGPAGEGCDDGNTVSGDGCNALCALELVSVCNDAADCCDNNNDDIIDDVCRRCACSGMPGGCAFMFTTLPSDISGPFQQCAPDGFCNIHDRNRALNCFSGTDDCARVNSDAGGAFGLCPPDGFCNVHDANHVLACFAGTNTCGCDGAAPESPNEPTQWSALAVGSGRKTVRPGAQVSTTIAVASAVHGLQSYQIEVRASGGWRGTLELEDVRWPATAEAWAMGRSDLFQAANLETQQMLAGVASPTGIDAPVGTVLAVATWRVSADAAGPFVIDVVTDAGANGTAMVSAFTTPIGIDGVRPAIIEVSAQRTERRARR